MISNIGEGSSRIASRVDTSGSVQDKQISVQKAEEVRQVRPVEKTESGKQADQSDQRDPKKSQEKDMSKYIVDQNQLVFEKYDKNGDLILRIPPSYKPVNERI